MTNIEEKFFKTFGIETRCIEKNPTYCCDYEDCNKCRGLGYPQITDRILLELICILNDFSDFCIEEICYECLKEEILCKCIEWLDCAIKHDEFKAQVQSLFKGGE